jgi:hypothetical protein
VTPQAPPGPDTRWTTLAQLIPGIAQTSAAMARAGSGCLALPGGEPAPMEARACGGAELGLSMCALPKARRGPGCLQLQVYACTLEGCASHQG